MKEQQEIPSVGKHLLFIDKIPNTMKLTWLFLSASVFGFTAQASAQRMSVALDNAKVEHVLEKSPNKPVWVWLIAHSFVGC